MAGVGQILPFERGGDGDGPGLKTAGFPAFGLSTPPKNLGNVEAQKASIKIREREPTASTVMM
jgi:hypothetical protein